MTGKIRLVTVYTAIGQPEAEIIRGRLENGGIPAILRYESFGNVYGITVDGLGQVEIQVPDDYAHDAKQILETSFTGQVPTE